MSAGGGMPVGLNTRHALSRASRDYTQAVTIIDLERLNCVHLHLARLCADRLGLGSNSELCPYTIMDCRSIRVMFAYTFARCRAESIVAVLSTTLAAQRSLEKSFTSSRISKVLALLGPM